MNFRKGNLIQSLSRGLIVHQVNCQGVMGSGFAKELRETYPIVWEQYDMMCQNHLALYRDNGRGLLGQVQMVSVKENLWVANLFGQQYYGKDPKKRYTSYDAIDDGFSYIDKNIQNLQISYTDVHHPLIGCGLGGGNWGVVERIIDQHMEGYSTLWTL